jgi:hypothetical protein
MNPHLEPFSPSVQPVPALPQVLYIARSGSAALIAALRRDGVDVIVAFDSERGARLLHHVHPQAILCAAADAPSVLAYAEPDVHVIVLGNEGWGRTRAATTIISPTWEVAAVAHRVREDMAAQEFRRSRLQPSGSHPSKNTATGAYGRERPA